MPALKISRPLPHVDQSALTAAECWEAAGMLWDLENRRLEVVLVPAPEPRHRQHKIRVVRGRNPDWYSALCASVANWRKIPRRSRHHDTGVKRSRIIRSLERLAKGRCETPWDWSLRPLLSEDRDATR